MLWWVLTWPRDGDAPCSQAHVVLAAKGEHGGPWGLGGGGGLGGSGGPPCPSSAGAGSCAAPHLQEEVTPVLSLSAVSTFRAVAGGPGTWRSPSRLRHGPRVAVLVTGSQPCPHHLLRAACPPQYYSFTMPPPPALPWRSQWLLSTIWDGTVHAKAHRLAKPWWTESRARHPPCPGRHCTAHGQQQATPHPMADSAQCHCLPLALSPTLGTSCPRSARSHTEFALSHSSMDPVGPV